MFVSYLSVFFFYFYVKISSVFVVVAKHLCLRQGDWQRKCGWITIVIFLAILLLVNMLSIECESNQNLMFSNYVNDTAKLEANNTSTKRTQSISLSLNQVRLLLWYWAWCQHHHHRCHYYSPSLSYYFCDTDDYVEGAQCVANSARDSQSKHSARIRSVFLWCPLYSISGTSYYYDYDCNHDVHYCYWHRRNIVIIIIICLHVRFHWMRSQRLPLVA